MQGGVLAKDIELVSEGGVVGHMVPKLASRQFFNHFSMKMGSMSVLIEANAFVIYGSLLKVEGSL